MIYELTYLINSQADYTKLTSETKELLEKFQFKLIEPLNSPFGPVPKRLAYPIARQATAYYQTIRFDCLTEKINDLEKKLKSDKDIIRYVIVRLPKESLELKKVFEKVISKKDTSSRQKDKVKIEELDKKLDEILDNNIV